jgi:hypothetical protein
MSFAASDFSSGTPLRAAALAADPEAEHWACACGWVPGTGRCRNRDCSLECLFQPQRETEAGQILRHRRRRRPAQQPFAERAGRR